jgi:FkbM family methyltransferase
MLRRIYAILHMKKWATKQMIASYHNWQSPLSAFQFFTQVQLAPETDKWVSQFHLGQVRFHVRPVDWFAFEEIVLLQEYRFVTMLFQQTVPRIVVDLGANIGLFSAYVLFHWPTARVYSVEASPDTHEVLKCNQSMNPGYSWLIYQYAIWGQDGKIGFQTDGASTGRRILPQRTHEVVKVPAITMKTFWSQCLDNTSSISLLKMDIEGAEEVVLESSRSLLDRVENMIVEVHPEHCGEDHVFSLLRNAFKYLYRVPGRISNKPLLVASHREKPLPLYHP